MLTQIDIMCVFGPSSTPTGHIPYLPTTNVLYFPQSKCIGPTLYIIYEKDRVLTKHFEEHMGRSPQICTMTNIKPFK